MGKESLSAHVSVVAYEYRRSIIPTAFALPPPPPRTHPLQMRLGEILCIFVYTPPTLFLQSSTSFTNATMGVTSPQSRPSISCGLAYREPPPPAPSTTDDREPPPLSTADAVARPTSSSTNRAPPRRARWVPPPPTETIGPKADLAPAPRSPLSVVAVPLEAGEHAGMKRSPPWRFTHKETVDGRPHQVYVRQKKVHLAVVAVPHVGVAPLARDTLA